MNATWSPCNLVTLKSRCCVGLLLVTTSQNLGLSVFHIRKEHWKVILDFLETGPIYSSAFHTTERRICWRVFCVWECQGHPFTKCRTEMYWIETVKFESCIAGFQAYLAYSKRMRQGLDRYGLAVKRTWWSCRGPSFHSQHPHDGSKLPVSPVPWDLILSLTSKDTQHAHSTHIYMHTKHFYK